MVQLDFQPPNENAGRSQLYQAVDAESGERQAASRNARANRYCGLHRHPGKSDVLESKRLFDYRGPLVARQLGFEIDAIRALLTIQDNPDQSCEAVDAIARTRLGEVERRIESLLKLKAELERMIAHCSRGRVECRIIEVLATPGSGRPDDTGT